MCFISVCVGGASTRQSGWGVWVYRPRNSCQEHHCQESGMESNLGELLLCVTPQEIPSPPLTTHHSLPNPLGQKILNPSRLFCAKGGEVRKAERNRAMSSLHEGEHGAPDPPAELVQQTLWGSSNHSTSQLEGAEEPRRSG